MSDHTLLDPKNDFVFKKLFAASPPLLADLINAVRAEEAPIEVVQVLNPHIEPEELAGKYIVLDILVKDAQGHFYNVEMQVRKHDAWSTRSIFYLARTLADQPQSGTRYSQIKPVIGVHLLDFELFSDPDQATWCFELRDRRQPSVRLGDELQFYIVELSKLDRLGASTAALCAWTTYFEHWQEEQTMNQITHSPVQQAMEKLQALSNDDQARYRAWARERALLTEISELSAAEQRGRAAGREEGREEGREAGLQEGERQQARAVAQRLLARHLSPDEVADISGLPLAEVVRLQH